MKYVHKIFYLLNIKEHGIPQQFNILFYLFFSVTYQSSYFDRQEMAS